MNTFTERAARADQGPETKDQKPPNTSSARAEHYAAAARTALRQAISFRDEARARCVAFDRRIDRGVMRAFALEWRMYRRWAKES